MFKSEITARRPVQQIQPLTLILSDTIRLTITMVSILKEAHMRIDDIRGPEGYTYTIKYITESRSKICIKREAPSMPFRNSMTPL